MQREFTDSANKILQSLSLTATDIAELNIDFINKLTRGFTPGDLTQPKKPDDVLKYLNTFNGGIISYTQGLSEIYMENAQRLSEIMKGAAREATQQVHRSSQAATHEVTRVVSNAKRNIKRKKR